MTFEELQALLAEWYEAGRAVNLGSMAGVDDFMDVQFRLREYARTLYESGKAEVTE
jgi:hypothetical protein